MVARQREWCTSKCKIRKGVCEANVHSELGPMNVEGRWISIFFVCQLMCINELKKVLTNHRIAHGLMVKDEAQYIKKQQTNKKYNKDGENESYGNTTK